MTPPSQQQENPEDYENDYDDFATVRGESGHCCTGRVPCFAAPSSCRAHPGTTAQRHAGMAGERLAGRRGVGGGIV